MFTSKLRVIFAERNINQGEFAKKIGISQSALSQLVRGKTTPTLTVAYKIAFELNMNVMDIWEWIEGNSIQQG